MKVQIEFIVIEILNQKILTVLLMLICVLTGNAS